MAKKIKTLIKLAIPAGAATPAPPVGTALGPHGLNIMEFVKAYNDKTADLKGNIIPVVITVYEDRTFSFVTKKPPVAEMIKKAIGRGGSQKPGKEKAGVLTMDMARKIAEDKLEDLNTDDVEMGARVVAGTARSMGVEVQQ
jgi:large subunit ribosomal protein L11